MKKLFTLLAVLSIFTLAFTACAVSPVVYNHSGNTYESEDGTKVAFTSDNITFTTDGKTLTGSYTINADRTVIDITYSASESAGMSGGFFSKLVDAFVGATEKTYRYSITRNSVTIDGVTYTLVR